MIVRLGRVTNASTSRFHLFTNKEWLCSKINEMPSVVKHLDAIKFWQMNSEYNSPGIHTDGSNWTLEVFYKGKYKVVSTDIPNEPIKKICSEMLKASGYKTKSDEIY